MDTRNESRIKDWKRSRGLEIEVKNWEAERATKKRKHGRGRDQKFRMIMNSDH